MNLTDRVLQRWRIAKVRPFIAPGSQILDIGSADGALFRQLGRRKGERCLGIDPTLKADIRVDDVPLVAGCFPKDMPAVEPFDVITLLAVLEHFPPSAGRTRCTNSLATNTCCPRGSCCGCLARGW